MAGPRVVVVGGGVLGLSTAYELLRRGAAVEVLERERVGAGASWGNAGTVSAGHPPLNRPGRIREALPQLLDPTSPLYVAPRWDPELWRWLLTFARHCTHAHVERCMEVMAPLGREALVDFDRLVEEEGIACGYRRDGYYDVCRTGKGLARAEAEAAIIRRFGYHPEVLDGDELRRRDPCFTPDVVGGVYYSEARTLDPARFLTGLADAVRRLGGVVREGCAVEELEAEPGGGWRLAVRGEAPRTAEAVVLATGPFSLHLLGRFGCRIPVLPGKGYHRDYRPHPYGAPPLRVACVLHETSVFCTPMEGFVRFAGTMEFSGENDVMRRERLEQLTRSARRYLEGFAQDAEPVSEWCGLRPMSADGLPVVGPVPGAQGLWVATGHGMLGLTLGPATGRLVAEALTGEAESPYLEALAPARFRRG